MAQTYAARCIAAQTSRLHRQHRLDPRHDRLCRPHGLRHHQRRADPDDAHAGDRMDRAKYPRQRGRAGRPCSRRRARRCTTTRRARACSRAFRSAASSRRRKSPRRWCSSPAPAPRRSPARRSPSMAASWRASAGSLPTRQTQPVVGAEGGNAVSFRAPKIWAALFIYSVRRIGCPRCERASERPERKRALRPDRLRHLQRVPKVRP